MNKIPTMFERDIKTFKVTPIIKPECLWVLDGEGIPTRKWDGTCCLIKDGKLYKRYDGSKSKYLPPDFVPHNNAESHWYGWRPVGDGPEDRWHREAWLNESSIPHEDGTYELIGPSVNKNPDKAGKHSFRKHGDVRYDEIPRTFDGLHKWLSDKDIEGIVFHHPDGRMAKIKKKDFPR